MDYVDCDAISLYAQGSVAIGGGVNGSIEVGYIKGDGFFWAGSLGVGTGVDASLGAGVKVSQYSGAGSPTIDSYAGGGSSLGIGIGFIDLGFSKSDDNRWDSANVGISPIGSPFGATFSHTKTKIKKNK